MFGLLGLIFSLGLLIYLTTRGYNIIIVAPFCAFLLAISANMAIFPPFAASGSPDFANLYMEGFSSFLYAWFLMFLLGAIFGEVMAKTGAASSVALWIVNKIGIKFSILAVVIACALLTYGGVSVFIVAFAVYPMAVSLFKEADLPRRFIPGTIAFGSVTFTMTSAGSPEIQNIIPTEFLGTTSLAAWEVSLVVAIIMFFLGLYIIHKLINSAVAKGEKFIKRDNDEVIDKTKLPHPLLSLIPLIVVLFSFHAFEKARIIDVELGKYALVLALGLGAIAAMLVGYKSRKLITTAISNGATGSVIAIANTCAVVGFGKVAQSTDAFAYALDMVTSLSLDPLVSAAIAITVIAGLTGSASGGQSIALPLLAPQYLDMGVNPNEMHRVVSISSGALDSLPHNGYVVTTIRAIAGETHKDAYGAVFWTTLVVPLVGVVIALALFLIF